jgi:hypothetical protein
MCVAAFAAASVSAAPPMLVATSPHFKIYAAESEADLRARATGLERYDAVLHHLTETKDADDVVPLTIYVVPYQEDVGHGSSILGYYSPTAAGPFAVAPRKLDGIYMDPIPRIVLFHEYAHHFMLQNFPTLYSPWFVEGFAEFYSTTEVSGNTATVGKPEPLRINDLMRYWTSPLASLIAPGDNALTEGQTYQLYARAWLLVHYLTLSKSRGGQIEAYLRARSGGQTEEQSFQTAFHISIAGMDGELKTYFASHQLPFVAFDVPTSGEVDVRAATAGEIAVTKLIPRLRGLQGQQEALTGPKSSIADRLFFRHASESLAADARSAGRKCPDDGAMQELVAESELLAGELDPAAASATEALRLAPSDSRANLVLAAVAIAKGPSGDQQALSAARKDIVTANRASPNDPMPLIAYYQSFADHGAAAPAIAIKGLERAQQLAPQDQDLRIMLAKEEIALKRYSMAADLLRPVALSPHAGAHRDAAQALLKSLPVAQEQAPPPVTGDGAQQPPSAAKAASGPSN